LNVDGKLYGRLWLHTDITERRRAEAKVTQRNAVLSGINAIFEEALRCESDEDLGQTCLRVAEQITGSSFGFIGEIGPEGLFHDLAVGDLGWERCVMHDKSGHRRPLGPFKVQSLYGRVLKDGKTLLTNDPAHHPDSTGTPPGHPRLTAFLGVPLMDQGRTIGMVAVGNREGGYGENEREALEALAPTIVEALYRKRVEKAIRESQQQNEFLASIINRTTQAFCVGYPDGRLGLVNHAFEQLTGYTADELRSIDWAKALTPPEWLPVEQKKLEELQRTGQPVRYEKEYIRKDGTRMPIELLVHLVAESEGRPQYYYSFLSDITDRKRAEQALVRSEKLASAGRLAATVAHEINNPLEAINNAVYLAWTDQSISKQTKAHLDIAVQELQRVAHLAQRTLGFYREHTTPSLVDLRSTVDSVVDLFAPRLKARGIAVEKRYVEVEKISAVDGEIRQIVSNLLSNSFDAVEKGGKILFRIKPISADGARSVQFTIADTGAGIAPERMSKIFEPFFTTKETVGTGLGLWVTKGLVQKHGGAIRFRSKAGKGTVFVIAFPATERSNAENASATGA
jgi:PAS domain S-box-containing protein